MYKFCVLAAGIGSRNKYSKYSNKSILSLGNRPTVVHIIDKIPDDVEIVMPIGHNADIVKLTVKLWYPNRNINFVYTDKYTGNGSGPGYSLLQCEKYLQCPFIFTACDTIVLEDYPELTKNWIGVAAVRDTEPYLTVATKGEEVTEVYDKKKNSPSPLASIGVMGIKDYKDFWEGLRYPRLVNGEHQTTDGLNNLKQLEIKYFTWFDTGTTEGYEYANGYFSKMVS